MGQLVAPEGDKPGHLPRLVYFRDLSS
jgi:hypothetical protein